MFGLCKIKEHSLLDELNRPLKFKRLSQKAKSGVPYGLVALGLCGVLIVSLVLFLMITDDRLGGEPYAVASIERVAPPVPDRVQTPEAAVANDSVTGSVPSALKGSAPVAESADQVEHMSGVKVIRGSNGKAPTGLVIEIPDNTGVELSGAPDPRLTEPGTYGLLPKIAPDGSKPMNVYARPVPVTARPKTGMPRIAVVFGGVGLVEAASQKLIKILPQEITLGFAPYGKALEAHVNAARMAGHELLLQVPMDSFDDQANSSVPETLLTTEDESTNLAHLRRLMGRMSGYIGLMNYQGGRFTADPVALAPVLREISARGLIMVDDGSSPRSLIGSMAARMGISSVRGDIMIDGQPQKEAINQQLAKLEALARSNGSAIGIANGYPVAIDLVADWARGLQARGIALVPLSAMSSLGAKTQLEQTQ